MTDFGEALKNLEAFTGDVLVGPVLYVRSPSGYWVPDWKRPGAARRVNIEIDEIEAMCFDERKL